MALPAAFEQRMQRLLGEEYPAFRDALARPRRAVCASARSRLRRNSLSRKHRLR